MHRARGAAGSARTRCSRYSRPWSRRSTGSSCAAPATCRCAHDPASVLLHMLVLVLLLLLLLLVLLLPMLMLMLLLLLMLTLVTVVAWQGLYGIVQNASLARANAAAVEALGAMRTVHANTGEVRAPRPRSALPPSSSLPHLLSPFLATSHLLAPPFTSSRPLSPSLRCASRVASRPRSAASCASCS